MRSRLSLFLTFTKAKTVVSELFREILKTLYTAFDSRDFKTKKAALEMKRKSVFSRHGNSGDRDKFCRRQDQQWCSFLFFNFPDGWEVKNMWDKFGSYGHLVEIYMARNRMRNGTKFGFLTYKNLSDIPNMEKKINDTWVGSYRIRGFVANNASQRNTSTGGYRYQPKTTPRGVRSYKQVIVDDKPMEQNDKHPDGTKREGFGESKNDKPMADKVALEMEKRTRSRIRTPRLEDVPELIHRIQSLLPVEEATRTCILSKSWLHAWSTIPNLRFRPQCQLEKFETTFDNTLQRYHRDNIPIESLDLQLDIKNRYSGYLAKSWIQHVASKSCVKELFLEALSSQLNESFTLPNELFSGKNLNTISLKTLGPPIYSLRICSTQVIKCVSLRVLYLESVIISNEVLDKLFTVCSLLEKLGLVSCPCLKNCKVKNLPRLRELRIYSEKTNGLWEINNVPRLCSFTYSGPGTPISFNIGNVTQLSLDSMKIDNEFVKTIESKFPLLENLTLTIGDWEPESLVIRSVSLKWLTLDLWVNNRQVNVQVYAPKLLSFTYENSSRIIHGLSFPTIAPKQIKLTYDLWRPLYNSFFLELRKLVNSSSKFNIKIKYWSSCRLNIDVDDLRKRVSFPVTNVEEVSLVSYNELWEKKQFYDALFSICRPHYINCSKLAVREMIEKKTNELKDIQVQDPQNGKWESLRTSGRRVLDTLADPIKFKLNWLTQ